MLAPLALLTPKVLMHMRDKLDELGPHDADDTLSIGDRVAECRSRVCTRASTRVGRCSSTGVERRPIRPRHDTL